MVESISKSSTGILADLTSKAAMKVLHVDDDLNYLKVAEQCLKMQGKFQVDTARSVKEAMEMMEEETYDAIISDYQMPGKDGLEFLKELREKGNDIPFIIFTGKSREEIAIKALNLGVAGYFNKHGEPETVYGELAHGIRWAVERQREKMEASCEKERLRATLDSSPDPIIISDLNGNIVGCNEATLMLAGYPSKEEIIGKNSFEFIAEKNRERALKNLKKTFEQGAVKNVEYTFLKKSKEEYQGELSASALKDSYGKLVGFVGIIRDITERKRSEAEVRRLASFPEENPNPILEIDLTGKTTYLNPAARKMLSQLHDLKLSDAFEEDLKAIISEFNTHQAENFARENVKIGDRYYQQSIHYVPKNATLRIYVLDNSVRRRTEKALQESERKYHWLVENLREGVWAIDKDSCTTFVNSRMAEMLGYTVDEMLGKLLFAFMDERGIEIAKRLLEHRAQGISEQHDFEFVKKDGSRIYATLETSSINDENGNYVGALAGVIDITERWKAEQALKESEEKHRSLVELAPDGILAVNAEGIVTSVNRSFLKLVGYDSEEGVVGKPFTELVTIQAKDIPRFQEMFSLLMNREPLSPVEFLFVRRDGTSLWAEVHPGLLIRDGNPVGAQVIMRDVSERKNEERQAQENQQKFERLFMSIPEAAVYLDPNERVLNANLRFTELFGYSFDEVKGKLLADFVVPEDMRKEALMLAQKGKEGYVSCETVRKNKKGSLIPVVLSTAPIVLQGRHLGGIVLYVDITERKSMIESLKSSEERLRILFESAPDGYYLSDLRGTFIDGNKAAEKITGYTTAELIGKSFLKLKLLPRSQILKAAKLLALNAAGRSTGPDELVLNRKDGTQVPVEIRTHPVRINNQTVVLGIARDITGRKREARIVLENQQKFEQLFRGNPEATVFLDSSFHVLDIGPRFTSLFGYTLDEIRGKHINDVVATKNMMEEAKIFEKKAIKGHVYYDAVRIRKDGSLIPVSISAAPILIQGQLTGYIGVYKDISQLKKAEGELRKAMEELQVMNEKLRVVGGLTRHDVRNKLTAVAGYAYLARNKLPGNSEVLDYLKQIEASIEQTTQIFDFAKAYETLGVEELVYVDLEKAVDDVVSLFSGLKNIKVINDCRGLTVLADSLLRTLFYNLVDNSLKYGEKLSLIRVYYEEKNSDNLNLIYEDDGVGIPPAAKPKLFDKGYTTGKGSGYGLYLIKRMMEVYGWTIRETGTPGKGAQFTITMPRLNESGKENYQLS